MEFLWFFLYFGFMTQNIELQNISFSENIEYCTNIIHNPTMQEQFEKKCNLEETNRYIMLVKSNFKN